MSDHIYITFNSKTIFGSCKCMFLEPPFFRGEVNKAFVFQYPGTCTWILFMLAQKNSTYQEHIIVIIIWILPPWAPLIATFPKSSLISAGKPSLEVACICILEPSVFTEILSVISRLLKITYSFIYFFEEQ